MSRLLLFLPALLLLGACSRPPVAPIAAAARSGDTAAIASLAAAGADLNIQSGVNGWTPLQHAIHKHQPASVRALLDAGARVDATSPAGLTPLMMAAGYGYDGMLSLLLDHGANPSTARPDGATALDLAVQGVSDIDRFTLTACQYSTVQLLWTRAPALRLQRSVAARLAAKAKSGPGCAELQSLIDSKSSLASR